MYKFAAAFFVLALLVPVLTACGGGDDEEKTTTASATVSSTTGAPTTPAPMSTPNETNQEQRAAVVEYLKAYYDIYNSLAAKVSAIVFPESISTAAGLKAYNAAITQMLPLLDGALSRLNELQPPAIVPETATHLQQTKTYLSNNRQAMETLQQAISTGNQTQRLQAILSITESSTAESAVSRATEQLLLTYNIPDAEVNYQFRGI